MPAPTLQLAPAEPHLSASSELSSPLPPHLDAVVWRADAIGRQAAAVVASGWAALDAELPGGGWPTRCLTEVLTAQPALLEWRLLGSALRQVTSSGGQIVVVSPPRQPHLPGLVHEGLDARQFIWVEPQTPAECLWATEQLIKSGAAGAIVAWLPQVRPAQVRRLQVCAQASAGPVFLCRPEAARHEASAAPLRVQVALDLDWALRVQVLKRRGPAHEGTLALPSVPGGLRAVLTPRLRRPSRLFFSEVAPHAVGGTVVPLRPRRHATPA